ncbi:GNAT family N-acetyltransferase [Paenibacillus allorhizosphaerae]|uniref:S-(2-succino)cysteine N-acetyltransferase n=1 Tax=Paenibacillus allorhizosphaerae TaxID=2849866 RepID=A0ABM8VNY9_9BACL|nr:GNAT family N-acetyltransferase [Paenibacillus allorhizosphaerae]CAG7652098.1 S-(2-succino)cysteine N-acetyltransferase [Paenibacillus allorhizosphaerae]
MTYDYRLATLDDAEAVLDLSLRAYEPIRKMGIQFAAATADLETVRKNIHDNACYVMEQDGRMIATVSIRMPWGPQPGPLGVPHIWWFAVDPTIGQKGIGSAFLQWIEDTIIRDTLKSPAVSLGTADKHPWLIGMYERRGYVRVGEKDLGKGHITVFLRKTLQNEWYSSSK